MLDSIISYLGSNLLGGMLLFVLTAVLTTLPAIRRRPALVFWMWLVVIIRFAVPIGVAARFSLESLARGAMSETWFLLDVDQVAPDSAAAGSALSATPTALDVLAVVWLLVVVALATSTIVGALRMRARLDALPDAPADARARARRLGAAMGLRRHPRLVVGSRGPLAFGVLSPVIAVPVWLSSGPRLDQILAHELAHIRRHDALWALLSRVASILFFFWPPMWWARARLHLAREQACDRAAIEVAQSSPRAYADTLVRVSMTEVTAPASAVYAMAARRSQLSARVDAIIADPRISRLRIGVVGVVALAMQITVGLPGADAEASQGYGALRDCVVTPNLGARILSNHPDADRDGDGQLSRAEICAHQRRTQGDVATPENDLLYSLVDVDDVVVEDSEMPPICIEELRCSEILESREPGQRARKEASN